MKKIFAVFILSFAILVGCDLQPKIASIPDSVGDFISQRYPTLLAEPDSEIYKTAVADYGVYASPTVYGDGDVTAQDYVLYSPADDYMMPAQDTNIDAADVGMPEDEEESDDDDQDISEYAPDTDVDDLKIPDYVNEKPVVESKQPEPKVVEKTEDKPDNKESPEMLRAPLRDITVEKGDTLYSLSRRYSVPVNDLAVMNKIGAPFTLSVGQKIKVPDMLSVPKYNAPDARAAKVKPEPEKKIEKPAPKADASKVATKPEVKKAESKKVEPVKTEAKKVEAKKTEPEKVDAKNVPVKKADVKKTDVKKSGTGKKDAKSVDAKSTKQKSSLDAKKLDAKNAKSNKPEKVKAKETSNKKVEKNAPKRTAQKMVARSSSKFSWPVRGKILSGYGSKSNGLFNDGINIKAARGATVSAAENGFVAYAGNEVKGMGNLVIIQHADGWMTVYAHMDSMSVRRGHGVSVGQKIGTVGTSGKVDQPQLHFEIRKGTRAYNPVNYLKK